MPLFKLLVISRGKLNNWICSLRKRFQKCLKRFTYNKITKQIHFLGLAYVVQSCTNFDRDVSWHFTLKFDQISKHYAMFANVQPWKTRQRPSNHWEKKLFQNVAFFLFLLTFSFVVKNKYRIATRTCQRLSFRREGDVKS